MNEMRRCHRCDWKYPADDPWLIDEFGYVCQRCATEDDL